MKMRTRAAALAHGHSVSTLTANTAASRLCLHGPRARGHTRPWLRCHRSEAPARSAPPLVGTPPSCAHTEGGSDRPGFALDGSQLHMRGYSHPAHVRPASKQAKTGGHWCCGRPQVHVYQCGSRLHVITNVHLMRKEVTVCVPH